MKGLLCATASLPAGFGLAQLTGVRPLGGLLLVGLAVLAGHWSGSPFRRQAAWYAVLLGCFIASHLLARAIDAWPAVAVVTVVATAAYARTREHARLD